MICPACDSKGGFERLDTQEEFTLYHCRECDVQFWNPVSGPSADWYENDIRYAIRNLLIPDFNEKQFRYFLKNKFVNKGKLLDIGCGTGRFAASCRAKGFDVVAIDFNKDSIRVAKNHWKLDCAYQMSFDEFRSKFPNDEFNAITFFEVLEHQEKAQSFIEKIKGSLKPQGYIALSVPNRDRWNFLPRMFDYPPNHLTRWNCDALKNLLTQAGFEIIEIKEIPFTIPAARQIISSNFNAIKDKLFFWGLKKVTQNENSENRAKKRKLFYIIFLIWRIIMALPSIILWAYARLFSKKDSSIYCLAKSID